MLIDFACTSFSMITDLAFMHTYGTIVNLPSKLFNKIPGE